MTLVIWKFPLEITYEQAVEMPIMSRVLSVGIQRTGSLPAMDQLCVWVMVDPEAPRALRKFWIIGTGHPMPEHVRRARYVGTVIVGNGVLVWHVFVESDL